MHVKPISESDGTFSSDEKPTAPENPRFLCRCGSNQVYYRVWNSDCGGFRDVKYRCAACGRVWWVEGPDS